MEDRAERFNIQEEIRLNVLVTAYEKQRQDFLRNTESAQRHLALKFQQKFAKEIGIKNEQLYLRREKMNSVGSIPVLSGSYENHSCLETKYDSMKKLARSPFRLRRFNSTQLLTPQISQNRITKTPVISACSLLIEVEPSNKRLLAEQLQQSTHNRVLENLDGEKTLTKSQSDSSLPKLFNQAKTRNIIVKKSSTQNNDSNDQNDLSQNKKIINTGEKLHKWRKSSLRNSSNDEYDFLKAKIREEKIERFFESIKKLKN